MEATSRPARAAPSFGVLAIVFCRCLLMVAIASWTLVWLGGCSAGESPPAIVREPQTVRLPHSGELEVHPHANPPVGDVLPVEVTVKFLAPRQRTLGDSTVKGVAASGARVDSLGAEDPAVVSNAKELLPIASGGQGTMGYIAEGFGGWGWLIAAGPLAWTVMAIAAGVGAARGANNPFQASGVIPAWRADRMRHESLRTKPGLCFSPKPELTKRSK